MDQAITVLVPAGSKVTITVEPAESGADVAMRVAEAITRADLEVIRLAGEQGEESVKTTAVA